RHAAVERWLHELFLPAPLRGRATWASQKSLNGGQSNGQTSSASTGGRLAEPVVTPRRGRDSPATHEIRRLRKEKASFFPLVLCPSLPLGGGGGGSGGMYLGAGWSCVGRWRQWFASMPGGRVPVMWRLVGGPTL